MHFFFMYLDISIVNFFSLTKLAVNSSDLYLELWICPLLNCYQMSHAVSLNELWNLYYFHYSSQKSHSIQIWFNDLFLYEVWSRIHLLYFFTKFAILFQFVTIIFYNLKNLVVREGFSTGWGSLHIPEADGGAYLCLWHRSGSSPCLSYESCTHN